LGNDLLKHRNELHRVSLRCAFKKARSCLKMLMVASGGVVTGVAQ
jgi:hypothetical protein